MAAARVLVVKVDQVMAEAVAGHLRGDEHDVLVAGDGEAGLDAYREFNPDLIVLDEILPGLGGLEVCRRIRANSDRPIIMLTESDDAVDRLAGAGADDYLPMTFTAREVAAYVQVVLRRPEGWQIEGAVLRFGDVTINGRSRTATAGAGAIPLTAKEFDLLHFLAIHPGQVFTRDQLLEAIWDQHSAPHPTAITVHIRRIRTKLEANPSRPRYIKTVWGIGYKLDQ